MYWVEQTLVQAGLQQWDVDALEKHLSEAGMGQEGQDLCVSYWRLEKDKVNEGLSLAISGSGPDLWGGFGLTGP